MKRRDNIGEFFKNVGDLSKDMWQHSTTGDKAKAAVFGGVLLAAVAGYAGHGPLKEKLSLDTQNVGNTMSYAIPETAERPMGRELIHTKVRDLVRGDDSYSAGRYAISRGHDATEIAELAMENPAGARGIFDIPGVDAEFARNAHNNVDKLPRLMRPDLVTEAFGNTLSGDRRDDVKSRTLYHERQAELAYTAGDLHLARTEAATALSGVSMLSEGGKAHYRQVASGRAQDVAEASTIRGEER